MEEIRPGVWVVYGENKGRFPFAHSLYLQGEQRALIDMGAGKGLQQLAGKVERVFLSHFHRDHVTAGDLFGGVSCSIHPLDLPGVTSEKGFYQLTGLIEFDKTYWATLNQERFKPVAVTETHSEGDRIDLGGLTLQVVHTPGHTPGHCAFLVEEYDLLFAADIDLSSFGPWYGNECSDLEQFEHSIKKIRSFDPGCLVSSHSRPLNDDIDRRLEQYGAVIEERHELIYRLLRREAMTLEQLVDRKLIYRRHPAPAPVYRFFEGNMLKKHLTLLLAEGAIHRTGEGLYAARR